MRNSRESTVSMLAKKENRKEVDQRRYYNAIRKLGGKCALCEENRIWRLRIGHVIPLRDTGVKRKRGYGIYGSIARGNVDTSNLQVLCIRCLHMKTADEETDQADKKYYASLQKEKTKSVK